MLDEGYFIDYFIQQLKSVPCILYCSVVHLGFFIWVIVKCITHSSVQGSCLVLGSGPPHLPVGHIGPIDDTITLLQCIQQHFYCRLAIPRSGSPWMYA